MHICCALPRPITTDLDCTAPITSHHFQFDTYRWMRKLNGDDWAASCLATNCLWVAYLAEILATEKGSTLSTAQKRRLREFRKRAVQAPCCSQLVLEDELFKGLWVTA